MKSAGTHFRATAGNRFVSRKPFPYPYSASLPPLSGVFFIGVNGLYTLCVATHYHIRGKERGMRMRTVIDVPVAALTNRRTVQMIEDVEEALIALSGPY